MKVKVYIRAQNKILEKYLGKTLVPENQIAETFVAKEMVRNMQKFIMTMGEDKEGTIFIPISPASMPYCASYLKDDCFNCPMSGQENKCEYPGSTYNECCEAIRNMEDGEDSIRREFILLAERFVSENKHLLLDNVEYFNRKNLLFREHTGLTLVPEDQIVETPVTKKMVTDMKYFISVAEEIYLKQGYVPIAKTNCPYCALYNTREAEYDCRGCPMDEAENNCKLEDTTVALCEEYLEDRRELVPPLALDLIELAKEYIEANKDIANDT